MASTSAVTSQHEVKGEWLSWRNKAKVNDKRYKSEAPDHFIALQITNPKIHSGFEDVQEMLVSRCPALEDNMVSVSKLHITFMVMCLPTEDHIARAKAALDLCAEGLQADYSDRQIELDVAGVTHFRNSNKVLFAEVFPSDPTQSNLLQHISDVTQSSFAEHEIKSTDKRKEFNPHITIAKGIRKIHPYLYEDLADRHFGREVVTSLQLCSMLEDNEETGYYKILHQVSFGQRETAAKTPSKCGC